MAAGLAPYLDPDAREAALDALAARIDGAAVERIGSSLQGRPIRAVRAPATGSPPAPPAVLVCAGIHGIEYIGVAVALGFIEALAAPDASLRRLRARADVWVLPSLNPDAYALVWERGGRGTLGELRTNARGVDLNRNYPRPDLARPAGSGIGAWLTGAAGSADATDAFFAGEAPFSEPESSALGDLVERVGFHASANLHSTLGALIPPTLDRGRDRRAYRALCAAFRRGQRTRYFRIEADLLGSGYLGDQEGYQHHLLRTWTLCVEHYPVWVNPARVLARRLFDRFNPPDPAPWVRNDVPALTAFFHAALDRPRPVGRRARRRPRALGARASFR